MGTQTEPLLRATGVRKIYRTGAVSVVALAGLDFEVHPGELVAVTDSFGYACGGPKPLGHVLTPRSPTSRVKMQG